MCTWRRSSPADPSDETRPWQTPHQRPWGRGPGSTMSRFPDLQKVWGDKCVFSFNFRVICYSNRWLTHLYNMHLNICSLNKGMYCEPWTNYGFLGGSAVKNLPASAGHTGSIPGSGRSLGEGNGNPLQYSRLGNPMDREAWWATVHGVTKSRTLLSD